MRPAERRAFFCILGEMLWRCPLVARRVGHHGLWGIVKVYVSPSGIPKGMRRRAMLFIQDFVEHVGGTDRRADVAAMVRRWYDDDDLAFFDALASASLKRTLTRQRRPKRPPVYPPAPTPRGPNSRASGGPR